MNDTFTCIYCVQLVIRELWFFDFIVDKIIKEPQLPYMYMYIQCSCELQIDDVGLDVKRKALKCKPSAHVQLLAHGAWLAGRLIANIGK